MPTDKNDKNIKSKATAKSSDATESAHQTSAKSTVSHPATSGDATAPDVATQRISGVDQLARAMPFNAAKAGEHDEAARCPMRGETVAPSHPSITGSTLTEEAPSHKAGTGRPNIGFNPGNTSLDRARTDSSGRKITTNQGVPVADNQNSLKAGARGPVLLEDFILREKITHFDHERIPERIVHARGSAAHGYFECYKSQEAVTRASLFSQAGKITPVFVRFSTVAGERGSSDTARDVRGFAVKFYTEEGNWDLVGNNIPVFFIQDAMKFPDLVHAAKPEPHFGMPQAATAHDTFWDFVSLMPESTHMLMWVMSDRALPRSYRMMQGFGVHTFRLVNAEGESTFVKFHWRPKAGTHALDWDESVKIYGADPDFHRRDLWEAIEAGAFPEWELSFQLFSEEQAEKFSFDVLDATKIVPEELVPLVPVGRLVLNRNPDNFFAETEQVAFCAAHVVPGIDFSNDPLLAGRIHSYVDTQISRLGGPNFHEIPINAPITQAHNNQRDGMHRQAINRGRVAYEPNSLGGGCPFQAGSAGFQSFREPVAGDKVRAKPEKFADHYTQAKLFYNSQTEIEKRHILRGFRFELTKVQVPAIRERVVSMLLNVDEELAKELAIELGMQVPKPMPRLLEKTPKPEVEVSSALSLFAFPGDGDISTRRIAILVAHGVDGDAAEALHVGLAQKGAVPRFVGVRLGAVKTKQGGTIHAEVSLETTPSVLYDAMAVPGGSHVELLGKIGHAAEFIKDQYRHAKPILALDEALKLIEDAGASPRLPSGEPDSGIVVGKGDAIAEAVAVFVAAVGKHRHHRREVDPPGV